MGVRTAADLSDATLESLLAVKNMGSKTAAQIMEKLEALREEFSFPSPEGAEAVEEPSARNVPSLADIARQR